jgi:hypothetical protein
MEPAWQRARAVQVDRQQLQTGAANVEAIRERVLKAIELAQIPPDQRDESLVDLDAAPLKLVGGEGSLPQERWRTGAVRHWHEQAVGMAALLRKNAPALYRTPEVRFSVASLLRQRGAYSLADSFYRRFDRAGEGDPWKATADSELWLLNPNAQPPKEVVVCKTAAERPYLDGLLSDACWQAATPIRLGIGNADTAPSALLFLAYDAEYFYLAASFPRVPGSPHDAPQLDGRTHDADLSKFDRLSFYLDLDRDYATYYAFHIDQRGWTAESCWEDSAWNPQWHVAAAADETHWRIEAAIPITELTPGRPRRGDAWGLGLVRTVPAIAAESWPASASSTPRMETFGLLRFE